MLLLLLVFFYNENNVHFFVLFSINTHNTDLNVNIDAKFYAVQLNHMFIVGDIHTDTHIKKTNADGFFVVK